MRKIVLTVPLLWIAVVALALTASFSFYQESLPQAFSDISAQFNVPIVVDQSVNGEVTMNLNDVTLKEALDMLCKKAGLFYFEKDGVYFVGTSSSSAFMKLYAYKTKIIPLKYLSAKDALSFLSEYSNYLSYTENEPMLLFFGPDAIYNKIVGILEKVDVKTADVYVNYTLYEISQDVWQNGGKNLGLLSKVEASRNSFVSENFKDFFRITKQFTFKTHASALVSVGKSAQFFVKDLNASMKIRVISRNENGIRLSVEMKNDLTLNVSSTFELKDDRVGVAAMTVGNEHFLLEVAGAKTSNEMSALASVWPSEEKEKDFSLMMWSSLIYPLFNFEGRYKSLSMIAKEDFSSKAKFFVGMSKEFAKNLYGCALIGTEIPATLTSVSSYILRLELVQQPEKDGAIVSSGYAWMETHLNDFSLEFGYFGNLEYAIGNLLVGVGMSYFGSPNATSQIVPYLSMGIEFNDNALTRFLYSPTEQEYSMQIDWSM